MNLLRMSPSILSVGELAVEALQNLERIALDRCEARLIRGVENFRRPDDPAKEQRPDGSALRAARSRAKESCSFTIGSSARLGRKSPLLAKQVDGDLSLVERVLT